ncbi:MAG: hypothetical protein V4436_01400 [Patescibacteria group bacterium]
MSADSEFQTRLIQVIDWHCMSAGIDKPKALTQAIDLIVQAKQEADDTKAIAADIGRTPLDPTTLRPIPPQH